MVSEGSAGPTFGELLAEFRRAAELTRAALAERAELSPRSIRYLESGAHQPYAQTINRLAQALELSEADRARLERAGRAPDRRPRVMAAPEPSAGPPAPASSSETIPPHNLPAQLTSFVGRGDDLTALDPLLDSARLVTLTGAGGIGKTRLALEVAANRVGEYPDGIWLVELTGVSDDRLVPEAVGGVLVQHEQGRRAALDWLADGLRGRHLLLVLDNCEHLVEACAALVGHLLRTCPGVRILATSREPLGIAGEHVWRVSPLHVPSGATSLTRLRNEPAVQLFVERARAASARFSLTAENAAAVVEICQRLDGMPLAIELAAGRTSLLTAEEIASRLDDRFRLLTGAGRTMPARHQTLRAVVTWSYELASEPCRRLLARLAPFAGGWTLEAAEAVAGSGFWVSGGGGGVRLADSRGTEAGHPVPATRNPEPDTLDVLGQLVHQSLVHTDEEGGGTRYRLLETLREYAAERLAECGETYELHRRHAEYYARFAEAADDGLRGPEQAQWASRLAREYDNLQAALRWSTEYGEAELAHRLVGALWTYWYTRPRGVEGSRWYERALALDHVRVPTVVRGKALIGATGHALLEGDLVLAHARCQMSLSLFQALDDSPDHAQALLMAGMLAGIGGEPAVARTRFLESLAMFRRLGARRGEGWVLGFLGQVATFAGEYQRAAELLGASELLLREVGDAFGLTITLMKFGDVARGQGKVTEARVHYEDSLIQARLAGLHVAPPTLLHNLACVLGEQGEPGRAATLFLDGLELYRDRADLAGVARCLLGLAELALDLQDPRLAARLLGAADQLPRGQPRALQGGWVWTGERRPFDQQVAAVRDALGPNVFDSAFVEGRALTPEQAAALASPLSETSPPTQLRQHTA